MPLLPGRERELAADAEHLLDTGVCTDIACIMSLVPEGDPPEDKGVILGERFTAFREVFRGDAARLGILAQSTLGHGHTLDEPSNFQRVVTFDETPKYKMCPLDPAFQHYVWRTFAHLATLQPAFIMIDDDLRLWSNLGCFCPLHLGEMGRRLGHDVTRLELVELLKHDKDVTKAYRDLLFHSLMEIAGVIRDAIDATDPSISGSYCSTGGEIPNAGPLARRLAGANQPPMVRIGNARYLTGEMRTFPVRMMRGAGQIARLDAATVVLAETDTCPQNRYSTGAYPMHAHYTASILEGCHGAKHWITRTQAIQPASGAAYRAVLTKHRRFYEVLFQAVQASVAADYVTAAFPSEPIDQSTLDAAGGGISYRSWAWVMGVLGLPCNYARMPQRPTMMTGEDVALFPDADLRQLLQQGVLLDGPAAEVLTERGFSAAIGVRAEPWSGPTISAEQWGEVILRGDRRYTRLEPIHPDTRIHSILLHRKTSVSKVFSELGSPAVTLFENKAGGRVAVVAATFSAGRALRGAGHSFYDEDRKRQLLELLSFVCHQPVSFYYPGDAEVYLKLRRFADGRYLVALFNLGHDPLDITPLASPHTITEVELLTPEGTWQEIPYVQGGLQTPLLPAAPKVFRIAT